MSGRTDIPDNANQSCVGSSSDQAGKASGCEGCPNQAKCASGAGKVVDPALAEVAARMALVKHTILVLSGKGGVGKSTTAAQLAFSLAAKNGAKVGLLDIDICGPSVPLMLGLVGHEVKQSGSGWSPVYVTANTTTTKDEDGDCDMDEENELGVMSIGFMLPENDAAVIWRGPRKNALIKQFLTDVDWGELDYLVIDTPPGTSDEHISIAQYLRGSLDPTSDGAVIVTTPQEAAMADVRKELNFCKKVNIRVLGVVENMSGLVVPMASLQQSADSMTFLDTATGADRTQEMVQKMMAVCPEFFQCSVAVDVFKTNNGKGPRQMADAFGVPYLGALPMDKELCAACENGQRLSSSAISSNALEMIVGKIVQSVESEKVL
jgi:Mrp family chromosome partitioning ATPase